MFGEGYFGADVCKGVDPAFKKRRHQDVEMCEAVANCVGDSRITWLSVLCTCHVLLNLGNYPPKLGKSIRTLLVRTGRCVKKTCMSSF